MLIFHEHSLCLHSYYRHKLLWHGDRNAVSFCRIEFQCQWICALLSFYPASRCIAELSIEIVAHWKSNEFNDRNLVTVNNPKPYVCKRKQPACQIGVQLMLKYLENLNIWYSHRSEWKNNNKVNILCAQSEFCSFLHVHSVSFICVHRKCCGWKEGLR